MRRISLFIAIPLFIATAVPTSAHYLLLTPTASDLSRNPSMFLYELKTVFEDYRRDKGRYPATWDAAWPYIGKRITGYRELTPSLNHRDGKFLRVKDKDRKPFCVFVIDSAKTDDYAVHSEGASPDYRIMKDTDNVLWYFKTEKDELAKLSEVERDYTKNTMFRRYMGQGDPKFLNTWKFDHPAAFDLLIRFLREDRLLPYTKHGVTGAMMGTAHLSQYKVKRPELESILDREKKRTVPKEDEPEQKLYIEGLEKVVESLR